MSEEYLVRAAMELFAESLRGGPARRLPSGGLLGPKLGGPGPIARMFRPVSADPQVSAAFKAEHEAGMRAEVLNSVLHALATWDKPRHADGSMDQPDFDALFVALAHLRRFVHDGPAGHSGHPLAHRLAGHVEEAQDRMAAAWLQPLISAKLNTPE
jgi:hypothetical protein